MKMIYYNENLCQKNNISMILKTEKDRKTLITLINDLDLSQAWSVSWKKYFPKRTIPQNRLLRLLEKCIEVDGETGMSANELHEEFLEMFAPKKETTGLDGNFKLRIIRTSDMDTKQLTTYINSIYLWNDEFLKLNLPRPEDLEFERFKEHYSNFI
jgi:hypothetical protein